MAEVLLFHHAQGQTPGFLAFADTLRQAGHTVHSPDLYSGQTFDSLEAGLSYARQVGFDQLLENGVQAAEGLPNDLVYAGFSLGVMPAQQLAQTRPGARGALFFHGCLPVEEFSPTWPTNVPVQIHAMDADLFFVEEGGDIDAARALVAAVPRAELWLYPGEGHLFADSSLSSYDAEATALLLERVQAFLRDS